MGERAKEQSSARWVVLKYGRAAIADPAIWPAIVRVLRQRESEGLRPVLVHSALAGVFERLRGVARSATGSTRTSLLTEVEELHSELLERLGVNTPPELAALSDDVRRLADLRDASPPNEARLMAVGTLMASAIMAAFLERNGFDVLTIDARQLLKRWRNRAPSDPRHHLSAVRETAPDDALQADWSSRPGIIVTQGALALDETGGTVLVGRGGSDAAASRIAARLGAERLEIWTDTPGMFSADPRVIPSARLLRALSFDEAQEIAAAGGKVLHPRCLSVAKGAGIPVHIRDVRRPDVEGTVVSAVGDPKDPRIKAISARRGLTLVSMESLGMWRESGFLADVFRIFAELGLSIDLVSTSESVVTVTLDEPRRALDDAVLDELSHRLRSHCRVEILQPCAAVSLVGARMRANLHRLAPALEAFEEHEIYLVSQAASDLNFTVVVEEDQAARLAHALHGLVVGGEDSDGLFGPTWEQLATGTGTTRRSPRPWWAERRDELLALMASRDAAYVYDRAELSRAAESLQRIRAIARAYYAIKANPHPAVIRALAEHGLGMECVSPGELERVAQTLPSLPATDVLFTPNFAARGEYAAAFDDGVRVTLDSVYPLGAWPDVFEGREVFARLDLGEGVGHHRHVTTAGVRSKFGVGREELAAFRESCSEIGTRITGLHVHGGSGIRDPLHWQRVARDLAEIAARLPDVRVLNLGGGLAVPERGGDAPLDLESLDRGLEVVISEHPDFELWLEPGRFLVSEAGVLLARVTQTKTKAGVRFVGLATGMNSLIRPGLYGAYHRIVNLTRLDDPVDRLSTVVGPICESGDQLGRDRLLSECQEGDVLLIANAGAYGHAMSSRYNLREPAEELMV